MTLRPAENHHGAAFEPTGDPMKDGVGAASYAHDRADRCDLTLAGEPKIQPMSVLPDFHVDHNDPDPREMRVMSADDEDMGGCVDIWVDRSEPQIRYYEMELADGRRKLIPFGYARIRKGRMEIRIEALNAHNFADIPEPKAKDRVTLLEEDKLFGYYAGGYRYADPSRNEPLI